ncbi:unnamed protein product (macronuclear) [Paramecium tetraurelia]|uniref:Transmembrane protein n=1 Tax=Paramecium tetraurelia TaxID=5888 RepID=A0E2E6_PARTE|nr:uncharacterized protein GSPATT00022635001 [Paramecium tetraurelia]CAK89463.1 unnamed protein product [Paramecium tetraurelia]|eukprot:XP_001456860.1 hypothetical protein (macronuclear) [Paramecium tetraurelia strain d4-2]
MIFSASLAYTLWVFFQWQTNQYSPKITNFVYVSNFELLDFDYDIIKITYQGYKEGMIDPFKEKVLIPLLIYTENFEYGNATVLRLSNQTSYYGNNFLIPKMKLGFSKVNGNLMTTSEMYVQIVKCTPDLLEKDENCASEETIQKFFSQPLNYLVLQIKGKQLNSNDGQVQTSMQEFYIQIEETSCYTFNIFLQSNFYEVKDSLLFGLSKQNEFINGALVQSQTNSAQYCYQAYGNVTYASFYIAMKGDQIKTIFEYPTAGDLLANIGSIVSILFMIRFMIFFLNDYYLNEKIINDLIAFYYPQFHQVRFKRNWRREIIKVKFRNENIDIDKFKRFYEKAKSKMEQKLTFENLIYEISRIYILIRANMTREELKKSHLVGLNLDFLYEKEVPKNFVSECEGGITQNENEAQILNEDDVAILSLYENKVALKTRVFDEKSQRTFFDINRIRL